MFGLEKFGITVVKPSTSFASKVTRFTDKQLQEKQRLPGPGDYEAALSESKNPWSKRKKLSPGKGN